MGQKKQRAATSPYQCVLIPVGQRCTAFPRRHRHEERRIPILQPDAAGTHKEIERSSVDGCTGEKQPHAVPVRSFGFANLDEIAPIHEQRKDPACRVHSDPGP